MKTQYAVYRSRVLCLDPRTKKDAIFKSKREADLLAQDLNAHNAGFYVAQIITGKRIVKI
jgi:hypothetical protein